LSGFEQIHSLDDDAPIDGTEIGSGFFDAEDVWERKDELIPQKDKIAAIMWDRTPMCQFGELTTAKQKRDIREMFGED